MSAGIFGERKWKKDRAARKPRQNNSTSSVQLSPVEPSHVQLEKVADSSESAAMATVHRTMGYTLHE